MKTEIPAGNLAVRVTKGSCLWILERSFTSLLTGDSECIVTVLFVTPRMGTTAVDPRTHDGIAGHAVQHELPYSILEGALNVQGYADVTIL